MLIVSLLILSNSLGLILSQSYVFEGVPEEYRSQLEGEIQLPYIPLDENGIEIMIPEEISLGAPFDVGFTFPDEMIPHLRYDVVFILEGEERSYRLFHIGDTLGTRVPMLNWSGQYQIHLRAGEGMEAPVIRNYSWTLNVTGRGIQWPVPILDGYLTPNGTDSILFETFDLDPEEISQSSLMINREKPATLEEIEDGIWGVKTMDLFGPGWNYLEIGMHTPGYPMPVIPNGYFIQMGYDPSYDEWDLSGSVSRTLMGEDKLFDQQEQDHMQELNGDPEIELYIDAMYTISIAIFYNEALSLDLNSYSEELITPRSTFFIRSGSRTYPMVSSLNGYSEGSFFPPETDDDKKLQIILPQGDEEISIKEFDIVLKLDHSPHSLWEPDPYALETYKSGIPSGLEFILLADWENFNRKDFIGEPKVEINGVNKQSSKSEEGFLEYTYSYILNSSEGYSGHSLNVSSSNSLEYANWLVLLIPTPRLFFVFPVPVTGWAAVGWFVMISIACLASVMLLFHRQLKPLWSKRKKSVPTQRFKSLFSPESELAITSKTYLGALFFFFATFWMLNIFEQPTPGLSILSSETPIWIRMFMLADASVWEEISGRVVLIGIPLLIIRSLSDKRGVQWKQLVGGSNNFGKAEVFLILISASLFGLAHLGWGPWKVAPTFVHGLLFGYLFVKVGLHASIVMHFLFDYTGFVNEITGIYGPIWMFIFFTTLLLGGLFLGDWIYRCQKWCAKSFFNRAPRPMYQLIVHSVLSIALGLLLVYKEGPLSISILFFSVPLIDLAGYLVWKKNRSGIMRLLVFIWAHFAWAAAPFGIAWAVRSEEVITDHDV